MYNSDEGEMKGKTETVATTFNMSVKLKEKAQIYVATHNRTVKESDKGERINLGIILNKVLEDYLNKVDR